MVIAGELSGDVSVVGVGVLVDTLIVLLRFLVVGFELVVSVFKLAINKSDSTRSEAVNIKNKEY